MAPSWNTTKAVPVRFDMIARWLVPVERTRDLRLHLAVELVEIGEPCQQRQRADAGEIAAQRVGSASAAEASTVSSPLAWPP